MPEKTVPLPLSGTEVIEAVVDKIRETLKRDCYLHPASAFGFFSARISIELRCDDMGREDVVKAQVNVSQGNPPATEPEAIRTELQIDPAPPNQVRIETGQAVPTASGGRIKYARKVSEKQNG